MKPRRSCRIAVTVFWARPSSAVRCVKWSGGASAEPGVLEDRRGTDGLSLPDGIWRAHALSICSYPKQSDQQDMTAERNDCDRQRQPSRPARIAPVHTHCIEVPQCATTNVHWRASYDLLAAHYTSIMRQAPGTAARLRRWRRRATDGMITS